MRHITRFIAAVVLLFAIAAIARPTAAQTAAVGSPSVLEGTIVMVVEDDFLNGRAITRHFLDQSGSGGRYELQLTPDQARAVRPGMRVRVMGSLAGRVLTTDAGHLGVAVLETPAAATPAAARKVLVLLVNITDSSNVTHAISASCDGASDAAAAATFGFNTTAASVDGCYQNSSYGMLGVGGASYPGTDADVQRVTITDSVTACNYTSWGSKADAAAANVSAYDHRVYVVPSDVNCSWAGVAYVASCPGTYCRAWVKAYASQPCGYVDAIAHEMGHNIGLMHASTDPNNDGTIDCEYCDDSDFMGYAEANLRPLNGPHRVQMTWVGGAKTVDASGGGSFTLSALNDPGAVFPQVATITPAQGDPYYLSYRAAVGYDAFLATTAYSSGVLGELSIHRWPGGITNTRFVTSLADGQVFADAANTLTIIQSSHTATSAAFTVSVGPGTADLVETAVGNPPALAGAGTSFSAGDTVTNQGAGAAGASTTRYYLSVTAQKDLGSVLLAGSRSVPNLAGGQSSSGSATLTIPAAAPAGTYYLLACADDLSAVSETSETNNCLASAATVQVTTPGSDLLVTAVGASPLVVVPGGTFKVADTTKNQGAFAAGASTTRYYLSMDTQKDGGDVLLGGRSVTGLSAGQTSTGSATVTVSQTLALGTYYLVACADDLNAVTETNETNNCRTSTSVVRVTRPDLVTTAITNPPATAARGGSFRVTDTAKNQGSVAAGASTTRYYLSTSQQKDAAAVLLGGSRSVSGLTAGKTSRGSATVTIPITMSTGTFFLLACADDLGAVTELNETNNCLASATSVVVH